MCPSLVIAPLVCFFLGCCLTLGTCVVARSFKAGVEHYRIQTVKGKLTIDEEVFFTSLEELIKVRGSVETRIQSTCVSIHDSGLECYVT